MWNKLSVRSHPLFFLIKHLEMGGYEVERDRSGERKENKLLEDVFHLPLMRTEMQMMLALPYYLRLPAASACQTGRAPAQVLAFLNVCLHKHSYACVNMRRLKKPQGVVEIYFLLSIIIKDLECIIGLWTYDLVRTESCALCMLLMTHCVSELLPSIITEEVCAFGMQMSQSPSCPLLYNSSLFIL